VIAEIWGAYETENIILIKLRISMTLFQIPKIFGEEHFHKKKKLPFVQYLENSIFRYTQMKQLSINHLLLG
jgi:hypothetical protein